MTCGTCVNIHVCFQPGGGAPPHGAPPGRPAAPPAAAARRRASGTPADRCPVALWSAPGRWQPGPRSSLCRRGGTAGNTNIHNDTKISKSNTEMRYHANVAPKVGSQPCLHHGWATCPGEGIIYYVIYYVLYFFCRFGPTAATHTEIKIKIFE